MQKSFSTYLIIVLALIIAHTGFARADLRLCKTECEYTVQGNAASPPCCKFKETAAPVMVMPEHEASTPDNCPHFGDSSDIADPLTFLSVSNTLPHPPQTAAFTAIPAAVIRMPDAGLSGYYARTGLSPPGKYTPTPLYRLNCSLLI